MCVHRYEVKEPDIYYVSDERRVHHSHIKLDSEKINRISLEQLNIVKRQLLTDINAFLICACKGSDAWRFKDVAPIAMADDQILLEMVNAKIKQLMKAQHK